MIKTTLDTPIGPFLVCLSQLFNREGWEGEVKTDFCCPVGLLTQSKVISKPNLTNECHLVSKRESSDLNLIAYLPVAGKLE